MRITALLRLEAGVAAAAIMATTSGGAFAQSSAQPQNSASTAEANGEIVVTARRREESLQSVPAAVTSIGANFLQERSVSDLRDLNGLMPNVNVQGATTSASSSQIFMRGTGVDTTGFGADPTVGIYLDDVSIGRLVGSLVGALDIERVEVLRGPQGTLYGRNSTAGAVKYVTRKPELNENSGKLSATVGTKGRRDFRGIVNLVLVPGELALRIAAQTRDTDGYIKLFDAAGNNTGLKGNAMHAQDYRASLRYQPTSDLTIDLAGDYTHNRSGIQSVTPTNCTGLNGQFVRCPLYYNDPFASFVGPYSPDRPKFDGGGSALTVNYDLGFANLKSVTSYRAFRDVFAAALFGKPPPFTQVNFDQTLKQNQFQQEIQLSSSRGDLINYTVGAFFYRERIRSIYVSQSPAITTIPRLNNDRQVSKSLAAFGEIYISPLEGLEFTIGGRVTRDSRHVDRVLDNPPIGPTPDVFTTVSLKSTTFTPKLGVKYQTGPFMFYGTYSQGYRAPGVITANPSNISAMQATYQKEEETSYEVGIKSSWLDGLATLNVAAFTARYDNLQATQIVGASTVVVSANARIKGVEAEASIKPTEGLRLFGIMGLLRTSYIGPPPAGNPFATKLKHSPETTFTLGFDYSHELGSEGGEVFIGSSWSHTGQAERTVQNNADQRSPAYDLVDARIGYRNKADNWSITAGANNLTNEIYGLLGGSNQTRSYQPSRRLFLTAEVGF